MRNVLFSFIFLASFATRPLLAGILQSVPSEFDFGLAPDDARISGDFVIKNVGDNTVALQALKPACGCTAAQFTPMNLSSAQDTKVSLTFNTRGYKGIPFHKSAQLEAGLESANLTVNLKGYVMDPTAVVLPKGSGVASFDPDTKKDTQIVSIENKSSTDLTMSVVQEPASWVMMTLNGNTLKANSSINVDVKVKGPYKDVKETSATFEAVQSTATYRFTIAIRTGPLPKSYEPIRPAVAPTAAPAKPKQETKPKKAVPPVKKHK